MKCIISKLHSSAGESLIETLVAILIVTFSCISLYFATIAAANINKAAEDTNQQFHLELAAAELQQGTEDSSGTVTITPMDPYDLNTYTANVGYYGGSEILTSYRLLTDAEEAG